MMARTRRLIRPRAGSQRLDEPSRDGEDHCDDDEMMNKQVHCSYSQVACGFFHGTRVRVSVEGPTLAWREALWCASRDRVGSIRLGL